MTTLEADKPTKADRPDKLRIRLVTKSSSETIPDDSRVARIREAVAACDGMIWADLEDLGQESSDVAQTIFRDVFHFHPLAIEDALLESHVPKIDDWGEYIYLVFHTIDFDPETDRLRLHELDVFLGPNYLVTYHTEPIPALEQLRRNIEREPSGRLGQGPAQLLYHVLDLCVAEYLPAIEHLDETIDDAQDEVFEQPTTNTLQAIFQVKRSALRLHRVLAPEREILNRLARDEYKVIKAEHRVYFRDVYDHIVRIHDITESLRDLISGALDTYLSAISNRTNEIMKTLTMVTVLFLPISFLTSFFGMNFFGETLSFQSRWPKVLLFGASCSIMLLSPPLMALWARWRRWS